MRNVGAHTMAESLTNGPDGGDSVLAEAAAFISMKVTPTVNRLGGEQVGGCRLVKTGQGCRLLHVLYSAGVGRLHVRPG